MEEWKDITGYEGIYQVSTLGRVRAYAKERVSVRGSDTPYKMYWAERYLKLRTDKTGYVQVGLTAPYKDGVNYNVHRLIAKEFIPNPNNYPVVNHLNSDRTDNRVENLEWCTYAQNSLHASSCGRLRKGTEHPMAILDDEKVREIRNLYEKEKHTHTSLGEKYGVHSSLIGLIVRRKIWKHVD